MRRLTPNQIRSIVAGASEDYNKSCKISIKKAGSDIFHSTSVIDESCLRT